MKKIFRKISQTELDIDRLHSSSHFKPTIVIIFFAALVFRVANEIRFPNTQVIPDLPLLACGIIAISALWVLETIDRQRIFRVFKDFLRTKDREERKQIAALMNFVGAIERKYAFMMGHGKKVAVYAEAIARNLKLTDEEVKRIRTAAVLHDIGNGALPDSYINKQQPLTHYEWSTIRLHPIVSESLVSHVRNFKQEGLIIRQHHERYDGRGYPDQLQGEQIELGARILAVAEAFEAMNSPRVYRGNGMDARAIRQELIKNSGFQFDPMCVNALLFALQHDPKLWTYAKKPD